MSTRDELKFRKEQMKQLRRQIDHMNMLKATQFELLKSTKLTKEEWNAIQAKIAGLDGQISKATTSINQMADDTSKIEEGLNKAEKRLDNFSDKAQDLAKKVPVIGDSLAGGIQAGTDKAKKMMDKWLKESDNGIKKTFKVTGAILGGLLLGGVIALWKTFSALLKKSEETAYEFSTAMTETARSLQMSKGDVRAIGKGVGDWVRYGQGWATAVAQIRDDMGFLPALTAEENKLVGRLATNAGLGAEEIANMYRHSQSLGMTLTDYTKEQEKKIQQLNLENGTYFTQAEIVKDIAGASDETLAMFGKQNQELEKQVLIGKKIGLNLNEQAAVAKSLLDIESSIEAEMEARVLTGKELNLDKARELALEGDISGAAASVMEQVGGINEFQEMNIIQKEALAKAAGMEVGQLEKALTKQANLTDQAKLGGTQDPGGGGLDAAAGNSDLQAADDSRNRRWGKIFEGVWAAIKKVRVAIEERLLDWFESGRGKDMVDKVEAFATDIANWITGEGPAPKWWTDFQDNFITPVKKWWGEWGETLGKIAIALGVGGLLKKGWDVLTGKSGKLGSSGNPMHVVMGGGWAQTALDYLNPKNKSKWTPEKIQKTLDPKKQTWRDKLKKKIKQTKRKVAKGTKLGRWFRGAKAKFLKAKRSVTNTVKKAGKGIWGRVSGWGKKALGGVKKLGSKAWSGLKSMNPIAKLKTAVKGNAGKFLGKAAKMGGKFAKGGIIGALMNAASLGSILFNKKLTPEEKAKQIIPVGASILGAGLGAVAGSIVPVVGTFGGSILGGFIGDWIGKIPAIQNALAPPLAKLLGGAEAEEVGDFILSDRGLIKFQKDDLVIGGTKLGEALGTGDNERLDEIAMLLKQLIAVTSKDRILSVDGVQLDNALADARLYRGNQ